MNMKYNTDRNLDRVDKVLNMYHHKAKSLFIA
jgi:hypothetical protein